MCALARRSRYKNVYREKVVSPKPASMGGLLVVQLTNTSNTIDVGAFGRIRKESQLIAVRGTMRG